MVMEREFRYWRRDLAGNIRRIRSLARKGECAEAKRLYKQTLRESGTSLVGWPTWIRLGNDLGRRCKRTKRSR